MLPLTSDVSVANERALSQIFEQVNKQTLQIRSSSNTNSGEATERVKQRIGPSQRENYNKYHSIVSEVEGAAGFARIFLLDK